MPERNTPCRFGREVQEMIPVVCEYPVPFWARKTVTRVCYSGDRANCPCYQPKESDNG